MVYGRSMHPEVHSDLEPTYSEASSSSVHLNAATFNLAMLAVGVADSDAARSRAIGISDKVVRGALDGNSVGGKFIGNTITFFRQHRTKLEHAGIRVEIDTFFTVREPVGVSDGR